MKIFSIDNTNLIELPKQSFSLEHEIQRLTEANLSKIFDLVLVKSEFELHGLRIDSFAFNKETNAFVIIEYKKDRNFSVIDQGIAYLNLMLNNKADFILEYNEKFPNPIKREGVDWSQTRVIFIAPEFTKYQQYAIGFKDFGIELFEVHKYGNNLLIFNEIKPFQKSETISLVSRRSSEVKKISEEIKVYKEEDLMAIAEDNVKELYYELKNFILKLGNDIEIRPTKYYVAFRRKQAFTSITFKKTNIKCYLNIDIKNLQDPMKKARDVKEIGHHPHGDTEITISENNEIPYVFEMIKQAYDKS